MNQSLKVNLRHLEGKDLNLVGQVSVEAMELDSKDEMIHPIQPVQFDLMASLQGEGVLIQGRVEVVLDCRCVRCLAPMQMNLNLQPWCCHIPLEGDEKAEIVNDCLDLTPYMREDILLKFPRHPICRKDCPGTPWSSKTQGDGAGQKPGDRASKPSVWSHLDELEL